MSAFAREYRKFEELKERAKKVGLRVEIIFDIEDFTRNMSSLAIGPNRIKDFERHLQTRHEASKVIIYDNLDEIEAHLNGFEAK